MNHTESTDYLAALLLGSNGDQRTFEVRVPDSQDAAALIRSLRSLGCTVEPTPDAETFRVTFPLNFSPQEQ